MNLRKIKKLNFGNLTIFSKIIGDFILNYTFSTYKYSLKQATIILHTKMDIYKFIVLFVLISVPPVAFAQEPGKQAGCTNFLDF